MLNSFKVMIASMICITSRVQHGRRMGHVLDLDLVVGTFYY